MAEILRADGKRETVEPANARYFTLEEMEAVVGGSPEVVFLHGVGCMVVNGDGHTLGLPWNTQAGELYPSSPIAGDVLVCERRQIR